MSALVRAQAHEVVTPRRWRWPVSWLVKQMQNRDE